MKRVHPERADSSTSNRRTRSFTRSSRSTRSASSRRSTTPVRRSSARIYENNDPTKRMIAMINFNTDVSDFWEFSGTGMSIVAEDNEAYKLGVNYIMYGLTH